MPLHEYMCLCMEDRLAYVCWFCMYVCHEEICLFISFKSFHKDFKDLYNIGEYETKSELLEVVRHPEQRTVSYLPCVLYIFPGHSQ